MGSSMPTDNNLRFVDLDFGSSWENLTILIGCQPRTAFKLILKLLKLKIYFGFNFVTYLAILKQQSCKVDNDKLMPILCPRMNNILQTLIMRTF